VLALPPVRFPQAPSRTRHATLAELFGVVTGIIVKAERQVQPLLDQHGPQIESAATPIKNPAGL
jgi:hypothetical protein